MELNKQTLLKEIRAYFYIFFGVAMYTFSASVFLIPHKIVGGGATGLATVLYYLVDEKISVGVLFLLVNAILLAIGFKVLGPRFGIKTIFGILMSSVCLGFWQPMFPEALISDVFMSSVAAGIINGIGVAIAISHGGSTGGTDIIALIINKYRNVSPGKVMMYCDSMIILCTLLINFNIEGLMYGFVVMGLVTFTVDFVLAGQKQSAQLFIFTDRYAEVAEQITSSFNRGVTVVDCVGWYSGQNKKMLIIVVRKSEALDILKIAKKVDSDVFMTMNTVMGVFGKGFEEVKGLKK
ncbi:YitT family protein [Porphyromonadaceae bacterium OttesenSCG-928-L07]|nr:YitT family protein [Porphyromonadaceae bacterium OttesenSCG-928-L07]MDL2251523.1 YitT family protein [Odoribacter sp. OttesenSCG-928-J03]